MTITQRLTERFISENTSTVCAIEHKLKLQLLEEFKTSEPELCFALLPLAASLAHVPLSGFSVGAIVKGLSGTLYFGANMEFAESAIGQTIHAEQAAFNNAWMNGETGISDIFVTASPCGHCRQFLNEITTSKELTVWVDGKPGSKLTSLLPEDFGPQDLGVHSALMSGHVTQSPSELESALSRSYSPYTHSPSAVVLTMKDGKQYSGAYAENAAFNPSLPPLQSALIMCLLNGGQLSDVTDVSLTERNSNKVKHEPISRLLCSAILPQSTFHLIESV